MNDSKSGVFSRKKPLAVMMSARANVFYLQYAKVCLDGDRVVYWQKGQEIDEMYNIPDKNTAFLLLGKGTSITDAAVRALSESGVVIGFTGTGGSPFFASSSPVFLETQSEYRPTEYMQAWVSMWVDETKRLEIAKEFLRARIDLVNRFWMEFYSRIPIPDTLIKRFSAEIASSPDTMNLLIHEANWAKRLYATLPSSFR
jgi:CRISPR-associated protein Cas1